MLNLFTHLRRWRGRIDRGPSPPYEVLCACGQILRGVRLARRQIVPCPACGCKVFVLARSPLPSPDVEIAPNLAPSAPSSGGLGPWRVPVFAGAATLAVLIVLFIAVLPFLGRPAPPRPGDASRPDIQGRMTAGRQAVAAGDFHLASQELEAAIDQDRRHPEALSPADRQELLQLYRQSDLLSRLLSPSLQEIVQEGDPVLHDEEWKARFTHDYEGKAVVFDDVVRFDSVVLPNRRRRPLLNNYRVLVNGREVRLALEDLDVLQDLPLERPQRLLFGGRLAKVEREEGGRWMVGFAPDSGVLLTDRGAAEAVYPAPVDRDLLDVLKRQEGWLRP